MCNCSRRLTKMEMMMMEDEFQDRNIVSLDNIDLSLLRLSSPPYDYTRSSFLAVVSPEISPLKRSSPVSDDSDQPKRRKISIQNPIVITSPLRFTYPETQSSAIDDPTRYSNLAVAETRCSHRSPVSEKQEMTPSPPETMNMVNNRAEEMSHEETNYDAYEKQQAVEEDCEEGMRIERSGDGYIIRLKCRCKQAVRVLFTDHHLYFKSF